MYLSVIVNNAGKIVAKVATRAEYTTKETSGATYKGFDGSEQAVEFKGEEATETVLMVRDCEIDLQLPAIKVDDDFVQRLEDLEEAKKKEEEKAKQKKIGYQQNFSWEGVDLGYKSSYSKSSKVNTVFLYNFLKTWTSQNPEEVKPFTTVANEVEKKLSKMPEAEVDLYSEILTATLSDYYTNATKEGDVVLIDNDYIEAIEECIDLVQDVANCPILVDTLSEILQSELDTIYSEMDEFNYLKYLG
jgi:hypothetical protein